jgi:hypothetical protein
MKKIVIVDRSSDRIARIIYLFKDYDYECNATQAEFLFNRWVENQNCRTFEKTTDDELFNIFSNYFRVEDE